MRARSRVRVIMRPFVCMLEPYFFHVFLQFKSGMPAVSYTTTPLRVYMLRNYGAVILVLAINSLKMKQMIDVLFRFTVVEELRAELISKWY